jgi:hypothetical protein
MSVDYGRGEYIKLLASRDVTIRGLVDGGYEFVTNAFRPGAGPKGVRTKDVEALQAGLRREGYQVEVAAAYNETGDLLTSMVSIWRRSPSIPPRP